MRLLLTFATCARIASGVVLTACVHDVVLPDREVQPVCGNGVVEAGEDCDVRSAGCVACQVVPTWSCTRADCAPICGDGVIGEGGACGAARRDTDCDVTGYWAARETDYTRDAVLGSIQTSSNWYLYRFEQRGDDFQVVEELDCGVHVTGSATVDSSPGSLRGLLYRNRMDGSGGRPARHGTSKAAPGGCAVTFDRWYKVRGAVDAYLPADFSTAPALSALPPLPQVTDPVHGDDRPVGADDPDGDGIPGAAFAVSGIVPGVRNSAQRDWKEYATPQGAAVPAGALVFSFPGRFDLQESILRVTGCGGGCALLASAAHAAQDVPGHLTLAFLGKTLDGARVSRVVADAPRRGLDADLTTCAKVRLVLPHDPSHP